MISACKPKASIKKLVHNWADVSSYRRTDRKYVTVADSADSGSARRRSECCSESFTVDQRTERLLVGVWGWWWWWGGGGGAAVMFLSLCCHLLTNTNTHCAAQPSQQHDFGWHSVTMRARHKVPTFRSWCNTCRPLVQRILTCFLFFHHT